MIEIENIIELRTYSDTEKLSLEARYLVYENFTFDLVVRSDKFSGTSHFCVRRQEIEKFCDELLIIYNSLKGTTRLTDNDSDGFIECEMKENGQLIVKGQVGGSHENHSLKFMFTTDQTVILKFIQDFKELLKNEYN